MGAAELNMTVMGVVVLGIQIVHVVSDNHRDARCIMYLYQAVIDYELFFKTAWLNFKIKLIKDFVKELGNFDCFIHLARKNSFGNIT